MNLKPRTRARLALLFLLGAAGCLAAVLVTCLPPERAPAGSGAGAAAASRGEARGAPVQPRGGGSAARPPAAPPERPERTGRLALIIDDAGYSLEDLEPFLRFPGPIAIAVLPHLSYSAEAARRITAAGKELLLHMPMEPLGGGDAGPGAIRVEQSDAEIESLLSSAFDSVPGARGLNNHMGSRATADERVMNVLLRFLKREGKYFVDSRTTPRSVGAQSAGLWDVPFLQRDVFVDNERDDPDIERSVALGVSEARTRGKAILIGHVHSPQILAIVRRQMESQQERGLRLAGLPEILGDQKSNQK
jgi:polysaccharide deacetylase 2 family uncharacterized protein YibQ